MGKGICRSIHGHMSMQQMCARAGGRTQSPGFWTFIPAMGELFLLYREDKRIYIQHARQGCKHSYIQTLSWLTRSAPTSCFIWMKCWVKLNWNNMDPFWSKCDINNQP